MEILIEYLKEKIKSKEQMIEFMKPICSKETFMDYKVNMNFTLEQREIQLSSMSLDLFLLKEDLKDYELLSMKNKDLLN